MNQHQLYICGNDILPGEEKLLELPLPEFSAHLPARLPVKIFRAERPGPRVFITGTIHGDELIGIDIINKLLSSGKLQQLVCGDVIIIPVVNVFGLVQQSRYLPDGRDLNRSFPGSKKGSSAARLAHFLFQEIITQCSHGIDLHSGADHRFNLPQIRIDTEDKEAMALAKAFAAPVVFKSELRKGSLREAAKQQSIPVLLFESAMAAMFDEEAVDTGYKGIINVLHALQMLKLPMDDDKKEALLIVNKSQWIRAPKTGIFRAGCQVKKHVKKGEVVGTITDFFGEVVAEVKSKYEGIIIGHTLTPDVNEGDPLFHIAMNDE